MQKTQNWPKMRKNAKSWKIVKMKTNVQNSIHLESHSVLGFFWPLFGHFLDPLLDTLLKSYMGIREGTSKKVIKKVVKKWSKTLLRVRPGPRGCVGKNSLFKSRVSLYNVVIQQLVFQPATWSETDTVDQNWPLPRHTRPTSPNTYVRAQRPCPRGCAYASP